MREEVMVLPPFVERGKSEFCPSKTDLDMCRKWIVPDGFYPEKSPQAVGISRDLKSEGEGAGASEFVSAQRVQTDILSEEDCCTVLPSELDKYEKASGEGWGIEETKNLVFLPVHQPQKELSSQGASPLHWGSLKRSRRRRCPKHHWRSSKLVDETNVLQVEAATKDPSIITFSSVAAGSRPNNAVASKRDHPCSLLVAIAAEHTEEECKRKKRPRRSSDSREGQREVFVQRGNRASLHTSQQTHQQEGLPGQSTTSSFPEKKSPSPDRHAAAISHRIEVGPARKDLAWPKLVIPLSLKEKAEDFFLFEGCKLPLRPKRRPRAVEKALFYCTPGNGFSYVSLFCYDVKEKKCAKKPRGLKAMESMDTDLE